MKVLGLQVSRRDIPVITILGDEHEVFQTALLKYSVNIFEENITQELAHYFYGLTPDVPDATHDLVALHGPGYWLEHFLNQWTPPQPRESHEANLFMRTLQALLSTFGLNKKEEEAITTAIAEHFPEPKAPIARQPKGPVLKNWLGQWKWLRRISTIRKPWGCATTIPNA